jgi:hypothetical protein
MLPPQVKMMPLGQLKPNKRNARTHSKKQIQQIANSMVRFGWTYPNLVDENGIVIAGFGRYKAAELLGLREIRHRLKPEQPPRQWLYAQQWDLRCASLSDQPEQYAVGQLRDEPEREPLHSPNRHSQATLLR